VGPLHHSTNDEPEESGIEEVSDSAEDAMQQPAANDEVHVSLSIVIHIMDFSQVR